MAVIFLYFALFLGVHFLSKQFLDKPSGKAERKHPGAAKLFQMTACFVLLFGFVGFRDITILNDTSHYCSFYNYKAHISSYKEESIFVFHLTDRFEYGFQVLIHFLIKYVSVEPFTIIIFSSLVITIGNLWFFSNHTRDIALMCFYMLIASLFFTQYCIIRQSFAIVLFYMAFHFFEKEELKKYYILVGLAFLFHYSAAFLFLLPTISKIKPNVRNTLIAIATALILAGNIFVLMKVLGLSDHPYYKIFIQKETLALVGLADLAQIIIVLAVCIISFKISKISRVDNVYYWMCVLTLCISLVSTVIYPVARINEFFWPFILLLLVRLLNESKVGLLKAFIVIVFITKLIGVNTFRPEWLHIEPYQFYDFNKQYHNYNLYPQK